MTPVDTTKLGAQYRSYAMPPIEELVANVQPESVRLKVHNLEITDNGPLLLDGKEIKRVTGIKLEWSVDQLWVAEIKTILLPP